MRENLRGSSFGAMTISVVLMALVLSPTAASAQFMDRMRDAARQAAERETQRQVEIRVRETVRCAFGEVECIQRAEAEGHDVEIVDAQGQVMSPADVEAMSGGAAGFMSGSVPPAASAPPSGVPGAAGGTAHQFTAGSHVLFHDDFSSGRVGDFPQGLEFVRGNMELVEWEGRKLLRATGPSRFRVALPNALPDTFTLEFDLHVSDTGLDENAVLTQAHDGELLDYEGNYFALGGLGPDGNMGLRGRNVPTAVIESRRTETAVVPVRILVQGGTARMFLAEQRIVNVPNAQLARGNVLEFRLNGSEQAPSHITGIRLATQVP